MSAANNVIALNISEAGQELPKVPEGEYNVSYLHHSTGEQFGKKKAVFYFQIIDYGEWNGAVLESFYNVDRFTGKPGRNGQFVPPMRGNFMFDYSVSFGMPHRRDRIALSKFNGKIFRAKVRTVKRNYDKRKYPKDMQYSTIDSILGIVEI